MPAAAPLSEVDLQHARLGELMADLFGDPLEFVKLSYGWGEGELEAYDGPDDWQTGFLREWGEEIRRRNFDGHTPVMPVRTSVVSGHGVGKSALTAWIADFITSTRPHSKGIVTANTAPQLETKTWAEIVKWKRRGLTSHWFRITSGRGAMKIAHLQHPETWRLDGMAWQANKPEAFAGQHSAQSTPYYIFDEASGIDRIIFETAEGGLTDGEPFLFLFGNGTKNSGTFYESQRGKSRDLFNIRMNVNSKDARMTNKGLIEQWIQNNEPDSDFLKIRVYGQFPNTSSAQFIPTDLVEKAMIIEATYNVTDPIICGVDVARYGDDFSRIRIRRGKDLRTYPTFKFSHRDTMFLAAKVAELNREYLFDAVFIDETGVGGGVVDRLRQIGGVPVIPINFATRSPNPICARMPDYMWLNLRDWLREGGALPLSDDLKVELTVREYTFDNNSAYTLEPKEALKSRGEVSPDDADACALTFAAPIAPRAVDRTVQQYRPMQLPDREIWDYNPYW